MIGIFYLALHSNPMNPPIKPLFSLSYILWVSLSIKLLEGKREEVKAQKGVLFDARSCSGEGSNS